MLRCLARRWPGVFLSEHHVSTVYGFQRVRLQARVVEDLDNVASNKEVALQWTLPDNTTYKSKGFGESLKKARQNASRDLVRQLPHQHNDPQAMIPLWRQVLNTTREQIRALATVDSKTDGGYKIVWKCEDRDLSVIGRGQGDVAELKALEAMSVLAEEVRTSVGKPKAVKAREAKTQNWQEEALTAEETSYFLQQEKIIAARCKVKSTESTLAQRGGFVTTLEWRLMQDGAPTDTWIVTGLGANKKASRGVAAKKMLEERGVVPKLSAAERKRANEVKNMCKRENSTFNVQAVNSAIQRLPTDAYSLFLVDVFRSAIAHNRVPQLVLPKTIPWVTWAQMVDEATFIMDSDVLSILKNVSLTGAFDSDAAREYYQKYRYLIASERRAQLLQALEGRAEDEVRLERHDMRVTNPSTPYFSLQPSSGNLPDIGEGDVLVVSAPSIQQPFLCRVTSKAAKAEKPHITVKALRQVKFDFTDVSVSNLEGEITAVRQIEALDACVGPFDPFAAKSRFTFYPQMRESLLSASAVEPERLGVVHGPPGAGKTYTACEIVKGWMDASERPRVLCVTDSNAAADNLRKALKTAGVRAVRFQKEPTEDCSVARSYKLWQETKDVFARMKTWKETLERHSVVVTTCSSAGHPALDSLLFDAMILDEATQTTEPSVLIPLGRGVQQCVLIGDPKQLPPTVLDTPDLQVTLFDRVDKVQADESKMFLVQQRRMHPDIMDFPSKYFYDGRLEALVSPPSPAGWDGERRVQFREISGGEQSRRASKCNLNEVNAVKNEVERLTNADSSQSIAVITPYVAQKNLLRRALAPFDGVAVNTIDAFQGNEADIVLFSTVRSEKLGFTDDPRRINVALTRAKRGLVVFGRRKALNRSKIWREWVRWIDNPPKREI